MTALPAILAPVAEAFPDARFTEPHGDPVARVGRDDYSAFLEAVRDVGFEYFIDVCAVDYLTRDPRFEVVVNLVAFDAGVRLRVLVGVPGDDPTLPTATGIFPGANFYEREAWDLFGIRFEGHPDLSRLLLPDEWEGHPLRKNSPVGSIPVQFKEANKVP
jgi:NADH-quinone oxidoreductase subunit C